MICKIRGGIVNNKCWVVLFVCLCIRVVYIEVLEEMLNFFFINVLRWFVVIRGSVKIICLDRGINVMGVVNIFNLNFIYIEDMILKFYLEEKCIIWIFNVFFFFLYGRSVGVYD